MPAVPDWVDHPDAYIRGEARCWLEGDPTGVELITWLWGAADTFLHKLLNAYFDWAFFTGGQEVPVLRARDEGDARKAGCAQASDRPKGMTSLANAAAAAGKAVVARREALGHEPKPVVDTYPRFMAEAKQYLARAANKPVHTIRSVERASERARDIIRIVEIRERLRVGRNERCAYQIALRAAEALAGPLNAGEKA